VNWTRKSPVQPGYYWARIEGDRAPERLWMCRACDGGGHEFIGPQPARSAHFEFWPVPIEPPPMEES
jgi:hypothetical protein